MDKRVKKTKNNNIDEEECDSEASYTLVWSNVEAKRSFVKGQTWSRLCGYG